MYMLHAVTYTHIATILGPYFGKPVHKEQVEGQDHNEWLWEVSDGQNYM